MATIFTNPYLEVFKWYIGVMNQSYIHICQSDGIILHGPQCQPSIYKSTKQFGLSFAYDAPKIWNELPDDVRSATSIASFRKKLKAYLFCQAYPP